MKKTKILSLLLCLSLFCALIVPGTRAYADNEPGSGMKISKTATANQEGSYTITLEAYATGEKVISEITKDVPTDIILVLDQSGSMAKDIGTVKFSQYEDDWYYGTTYHTRNQDYYEYRHNGGSSNLWHKLADESYVSVSVKKSTEYTALSTSLVNYASSWGSISTSCYFYYANNLYEKVDEEYKKVEVDRQRNGYTYLYTYTFYDGSTVTSSGNDTVPNLGSHTPLYTPASDGDSTVYTYTYTDSAGVVQTIGTSTGASTRYTPAFYQRSTTTSGGGSRLNALKSAANAFANAVAVKAAGEDGNITTTADNIDHRIAVVGYADTDWDYDYNTGVFIGNTLNRYEDAAAEVYSTALQDMSTTNGKNNVTASLNALQASGATRTDYGLTMANGILNANPVPTGETRNRVVIVFTDGSPTNSNGFQKAVANSAISTANAIKAGGTTVYSIGIFSGADASTAGEEPDEDYYDYGIYKNYTDAEMSAACNWFMQKVSSNNGTPRTPSYYLSAGDEVSLNSIFQQISDQIETGGSSTTLDANAEIRDVVSNAFTMPENTTDINLYTAESNGSTDSWKSRVSFINGTTSINESERTISVSGFSFKDNWCGNEETNGQTTFHNGKKLIIEFTVKPEAGFLGGNDVITNASAGIYENGSAQTPVMNFEQPKVNVPIDDVTVEAKDKNVYLKGSVTTDQLKSDATVKVGDVSLDLTKDNYGLADWQTEYVNITVTITDKDGKTFNADDLTGLTEDKDFTVTVTVSPKTAGTTTPEKGNAATAKSGTDTKKINVFKPVLTFKDSEVYYGADAPTKAEYDANNANNLTNTVWKHGETLSTAEGVTMIGTASELTLTYTPDSAKIEGGKVNTKQDIAVDVTVKIGETDVTDYTTFNHSDCTGKTCTVPERKEFLLHVKTCQLTITKTGGANNEPYVFNIYKDDSQAVYTQVTIVPNNNRSVTIYELPVGAYTIKEDTGWSWRFTPSYSVDKVVLSKDTASGTITCTNTQKQDKLYWLNGFSQVVRNIFGVKH